nr:MAG: putative phosphoesterase, Icc family [Candidatus Nanosalinarum sp. J07AB56]
MVEKIQAVEITALGDTHGRHEELPDIDTDILVFAGDLTQDGSVREAEEFNRWLGGLDVKHKVVVAGNHDQCLIGDDAEPRGLLSNATYLEDEKAEIEGLSFYGMPWVPELPGPLSALQKSTFVKTRNEMSAKVQGIPEDTDVLLTHAPPRGLMDRTFLVDPRIPFLRSGSRELRKKVKQVNPRYHIFGHIHNQNSVCQTDGTVFANVSISKYQGENHSPKKFTINDAAGRVA